MQTATLLRRVLGCSAILSLILAGCGERVKMGRVSGKVTYKGQPVPNGAITFLPSPSGPPATGAIENGTYTLQTPEFGRGAVLGKHEVMITALQDAPTWGPEERTPLPPPIIPVKFGDTSTSGLTAEVQEGENTIDFDLTDEPVPAKK